jgi:hypothetical protein
VKVAIPQDDYTQCAALDEFIVGADIDLVFSPLTNGLDTLYPLSMQNGVRFCELLTGYWEDSLSSRAASLGRRFPERTWDLGQRVRSLPPNLGSAAGKKAELALQFSEYAASCGLVCNVSLKNSDALLGFDWWRFLGDCRFTIGRRGGASLEDPWGRLARRVELMSTFFPDLSSDRIRRLCLLANRTERDFSAIGPRIFESAALGVCQVLEEDFYLDGLEPWRHYLPLASGMRNRSEIIEAMKDLERCEEIAANARELLIDSGTYSYGAAVTYLVREALGIEAAGKPKSVIDIDEGFFPHTSHDEPPIRSIAARTLFGLRSNQGLPIEIKRWKQASRSKQLIAESFLRPWTSLTRALSSLEST